MAKLVEEKKAWALLGTGYTGGLDGDAYSSVFFQNSNNSVRVTDAFMEAVEQDSVWETKSVTTGKTVSRLKAKDIFRQIAQVAHACGDPGLQFDSTVNRWHTCKSSGRINASNPCSEFMFLDDSACNLASLNLMKFLRDDGSFDVELMSHVIDVMITAQEILVGNARYPTDKITENSLAYRPLGIGYANLGALLMAQGLPYDSDEGRAYAAAVTSLLTGEAYAQSARLAACLGPFEKFEENREPMLDVIHMHVDAVNDLADRNPPQEIYEAASTSWHEARDLGQEAGFRNAQVSVLAPTGTIGFMMDCDTMGVEPDIALIKYKSLVGGGSIRIVNKTVPLALKNLGYGQEAVKQITSHIDKKGTAEGCPHLDERHLEVFDCALKPKGGTRVIAPEGHLKMMAAIQPFISGAISKTVNLPGATTVDEIEKVYLDAWKNGTKAISIYREGSKKAEPLSTRSGKEPSALKPVRRKLPDERASITHKFDIAGLKGYLIVGLYEDGQPGEIFIKIAKEGSTISGLMDSFALATSLTLQYGVPLKALVEKFTNSRFEPSGYTNNRDIPYAKSIMDYIFTYLSKRFLEEKDEAAQSIKPVQANPAADDEEGRQMGIFEASPDAPLCPTCGFIMVLKGGSCYYCTNCYSSSGACS